MHSHLATRFLFGGDLHFLESYLENNLN